MKLAAFNTGPDFHLLDHIAPLAHLFKMPLYLTEEKNEQLARKYYPTVTSRLMPDLELHLSYIAEKYDILFECKYWQSHLKKLFRDLYHKELELIFCPHGQSDKGYATPLLAPYQEQSHVLFYGKLMQTMLKELNIPTKGSVIGNYRLHFYLEHRSFYDDLVEKEVFSRLPPHRKTLLYAPTWRDADQASTFFEATPSLIASLPPDWNLIVKVHPLLEQRDPAYFYRTAHLTRHPHVLLVSEFPPIYPLLNRVDAYLGDYSSIGYDFLFFERPMFFLTQSNLPKGRLHSCGLSLSSPTDISQALSLPPLFANQQKELYHFAFSEMPPIPQILHSLSGGKTNTMSRSFISSTAGRASNSNT